MKRGEQLKHNQKVINQVSRLLIKKYRTPSYRTVCHYLNKNSLRSSIGNKWTERSLYRMLQRSGYRGLWGLNKIID
tara:strand:+ start:4178 stop:4405 length:228 start_codon:yes stop_codon:yes gene_type:complete